MLVTIAAFQSFGMDLVRTGHLQREGQMEAQDTVIYNNSKIFKKYRSGKDGNIYLESSALSDSSLFGTKQVLARDTIQIPDSLRETDPFRYKWYLALVDSLTHAQVRDSLRKTDDTLTLHRIDSIYYADSAILAKMKFEQWYNSLSKEERKKYNFEQKMKKKRKEIDSTLRIKDKKKAERDSIIETTPRILNTFAIPDSMQYKRIVTWTRDPYFSEVQLHPLDTDYNYHFNDAPYMKKDLNAVHLGLSGSPVLQFDYFKRDHNEGVSFYEPYEVYSFSPSTLPMYNTKTPYTELAYWGTLFSSSQREESNIHVLTSQNILPEFNFTLMYNRYGANGLLMNEKQDNRTAVVAGNYMGRKYLAHFGYIYNKTDRNENGGIIDSYWIRDTTVGSKDIPVYLNEANKSTSLIKKHTWFVDQTFRIPFSFLNKLKKKKTDSTGLEKAAIDSSRLDMDITTAFIGHSSELSYYRRIYQDRITGSDQDKQARDFYDNKFYINPLESYDSIRVTKLDNKIFLKLQPWASDGIISRINVGIGDKLQHFYMYDDLTPLAKPRKNVWNSIYLYGGAEGQYKQYFNWDADAQYTFFGDELNDLYVGGNLNFQFFPFRKHKKDPILINAHVSTSLKEPEYFEKHYYSNHFKWNNDFSKESETRAEFNLSIPHWGTSLEAGYALLGSPLYYDGKGIIRQNHAPMSVARLGLMQNFKASIFHFDNRIMGQWSSNDEVVPLPALTANLKWYVQFDIHKPGTNFRAMQMQLGVNATYNTAWYAPGYNPATGQFVNQRKEKYGNCPYFDIFANIQWKRACIFVKFQNAGQGWPMEKADYFSAAGYIRPQRVVKFGIYWPFYTQPRKNKSMSGQAGSGRGSESGASGGGRGNMLNGFGGRGNGLGGGAASF